MMRILKIALAIAGLVLVPVLVSLFISTPWSGKDIARERGIAHRTAVAHRGASYLAPENTTAAFELARDIGADYIETDVQRTKDGKLIVVHDDTFKRTTDVADVFPGREKDPVGSFTMTEVRRLDAGAWFNSLNPERAQAGYKGLCIPTFMQYLEIARKGKNRPGLLIELKKPSKYPGIEKQILSELRIAGWINARNNVIADPGKSDSREIVTVGHGDKAVILQSFEAESMSVMKRLAPGIMRNYLVDEDREREMGGFDALIKTAIELDADIGPSGYMGWPWYVREAHKNNRFFFVYTIDKKLHFILFTWFGADGIITNRIDRFLLYSGRALSAQPSELLKRYR